ncbi:hypothetical protein A8C32_11940 [Flavivirga aquatica]|uniref:Uncharacterized protein n=1 Tax=Flavivirga aquatica TaxID=1849968 RepID=A0A1E5TDG8_9FLAO|nr:hypothetical protein A8C32_11940 [Flavivirga aquatica]
MNFLFCRLNIIHYSHKKWSFIRTNKTEIKGIIKEKTDTIFNIDVLIKVIKKYDTKGNWIEKMKTIKRAYSDVKKVITTRKIKYAS